ncbi:NlpC/P60 family protein [Geomonas sp. RF6]|uniref:NlpC/P60 family protein n=1 Tax=Geomonas sp. RF6 TaxID=2897342 RepID=UPI001E3B0CAC|nr:NlpC/P60 family protein [Geomonas sp. RF6]UFS71551.1 NlpC/P60 family protein [Geomonas sp. RF6]
MKSLFLSLLLLLAFAASAAAGGAPRYAVATSPVPVLNTPDFATVFGGSVELDPCRGVRPIEFVALTGTLFRVEGEETTGGVRVYRVTTSDYPYPTSTGYYVDARFVAPVEEGHSERPRRLPPLSEVQRALLAPLGKPYVWGGNVKDGVPLLARYYPKGDPLAGVDCSGLLYEATGGYTPRNTSALTSYGSAVPAAGLSADELARRLRPLDLLVWKGHVMIVLDRETLIESTMGCAGGGGVHRAPLKGALAKLMKSRQPLDAWVADTPGRKGFVVRRWFPQ